MTVKVQKLKKTSFVNGYFGYLCILPHIRWDTWSIFVNILQFGCRICSILQSILLGIYMGYGPYSHRISQDISKYPDQDILGYHLFCAVTYSIDVRFCRELWFWMIHLHFRRWGRACVIWQVWESSRWTQNAAEADLQTFQ